MTEIFYVVVGHLDDANKFVNALGWDGPDNFSVPLVADRPGKSTYYASMAPASDEFLAALESAQAGTLPEGIDWEAFGLTEQKALAVASRIERAVGTEVNPLPSDPNAKFHTSIKAKGLVINREEESP